MSSETDVCDILQVLMAKHCHGSNDLPRDAVCRFAGSGDDGDERAAALDSAVARLDCVEERPNERYALRHTEELVDFLVEVCDLDLLPPLKGWDSHGTAPLGWEFQVRSLVA